MHKYSKEAYRKFLDKFCESECSDNDCILKSFLVRMQPDVRMLVQLKCLQYFALEQNKELSREELMKKWVSEGFAKAFGELYEKFIANKTVDKIDAKELYLTVKKGVKK